MASKTASGDEKTSTGKKPRRPRVKQTDIPRLPLERALQVPRAISENYAKRPTRPIDVAAALGTSPRSSNFPLICGASIGYGITDGGAKAQHITNTSLGNRIVSPVVEGDDQAALREAALMPNVHRQFLENYDGSPLPSDNIAHNMLESFGVPRALTAETYETIRQNADLVGFITHVRGKPCINLNPTPTEPIAHDVAGGEEERVLQANGLAPSALPTIVAPEDERESPSRAQNNRVYISHGEDLTVVSQIKELLEAMDLVPVISIEEESTSKPLSEKVFSELRSCAAGIIHVRPERTLFDEDGGEQLILNDNVLIEIGAAWLHFGSDQFILLVEEGTSLPSNISGSYEVRYSGDELSAGAMMKLIRAVKKLDRGE
ncbi:MAG: hypothetical protein F4Y11_09390 [Chloroflexi bacterium]|nr:hypothetical protein [Chloroflexota bacterium]